MEQIETLLEAGTQIGGSQSDRSVPHDQEIGRELRIPQQLRSWFECRHTHQDHRYHQAALQQPQDCAEETVKTAESGLLHHPACDPGGKAEQKQDGKKDDEKSENLS